MCEPLDTGSVSKVGDGPEPKGSVGGYSPELGHLDVERLPRVQGEGLLGQPHLKVRMVQLHLRGGG